MADQDGKVAIFPNPGSGVFSLLFSEAPTHPVSVKLTDMQGNVVYANIFTNMKGGNITLDVATLPNAVYMATITTDDFVANKMITVIR